MNTPELNWVETPEADEVETLLLNASGAIDQSCSRCKAMIKDTEDDWGVAIKANMYGVTTFEVEFFCPVCLDAYLINRNRVNECRLDGAKDPAKCASKKAKREGEGDHK